MLTDDEISLATVVRADTGALPRHAIVENHLIFFGHKLFQESFHSVVSSVLKDERQGADIWERGKMN